MLGINKIIVSDQFDDRGNKVYVVEVDYYFETEKDEFGLPSLDLSRNTRLYANFQSPSSTILKQELVFPTFLGTKLNPSIQVLPNGYRYPFLARFNVDSEESLNFVFEFQLFLDTKPYDRETRITLFSAGDLIIENDDNIAIEDKRTDFYDNIFNFDLFPIGKTKGSSTVSDLYVSYGKDEKVKSMFFFDKQKFLIDNSDFGKILNNSKLPRPVRNKILNNSNINNLKITRRKISYLRDFENRPYPIYKNEVPKTIAVGSESEGVFGSTVGTIEEAADLDLLDIEYEKIIAFNDENLDDVGMHQYSLDLRVKDGILTWLIDTLNELTKAQATIRESASESRRFGTAVMPAIGKIVRSLFALNSDIEITQKDLRMYLANLTKHDGSRLLLESYITNLINKVSNLIGKSGLISQENSSYSKVYSKNNSDLFFLDLKKDFPTIVDFEDATDLTYDYMGIQRNSSVGASRISKQEMQTRADQEFKKIIKQKPSDGFANLSQNIFVDVFGFTPANEEGTGQEFDTLQLAYFNFEPNYFAFLSPVRIGQTNVTLSNAFNFDIMTREHFKKKYDDMLTPQLSVSYYLQQNGVSVGQDFFTEDPPKEDQSKNQAYFPANIVFPDADRVNERPVATEDFKSGLSVEVESNASKTFANMFLRNEEGWDLSREDFNLANTDNILKSIGTDLPLTIESSELRVVREMPNQIRAIFASPSDKCVNQWLSPSIEGDYIYSPNTYYTIKQNYMNLIKIEYLSGFKKDDNGIPDIKEPVFKKLSDLDGTGKIICRASIYNDTRFRVGVGFDKVSYADKYFILDLTE